jgi:hypothetical protein
MADRYVLNGLHRGSQQIRRYRCVRVIDDPGDGVTGSEAGKAWLMAELSVRARARCVIAHATRLENSGSDWS